MNRRWPNWHYVHLRHRIFMTIVVSIVMTAACVGLATHLLGWGGYRSELSKFERFGSARFADVWNDPERLRQLAAEVESNFEVSLVLRDANGRVVYGVVPLCPRPDYRLDINAKTGKVGTLALCWRRSPRHGMVAIF